MTTGEKQPHYDLTGYGNEMEFVHPNGVVAESVWTTEGLGQYTIEGRPERKATGIVHGHDHTNGGQNP